MPTIASKFQPDRLLLQRLEAPESEPLNLELKNCPVLKEFLSKALPLLDQYPEHTQDVLRYLMNEGDYLPASLVPDPPIAPRVRNALKELLSTQGRPGHAEELIAKLQALKQHMDEVQAFSHEESFDIPKSERQVLEQIFKGQGIQRAERVSTTIQEGYFGQLVRWRREAPRGEETARKEAVARIHQCCDAKDGKLDLSNLGLKSVPPVPVDIKCLDLSKNPLVSLKGLPQEMNALTWLSLSDTQLTTLQSVPPSILQNPRVTITVPWANLSEETRAAIQKKTYAANIKQ